MVERMLAFASLHVQINIPPSAGVRGRRIDYANPAGRQRCRQAGQRLAAVLGLASHRQHPCDRPHYIGGRWCRPLAFVGVDTALIRIQDVIFLSMSSDPASGSRPVWAQVCLLHLNSYSEVDAGGTRRVLGDVLAWPEVRRRESGQRRSASHRRMGNEQLLPELTNAVVCRL